MESAKATAARSLASIRRLMKLMRPAEIMKRKARLRARPPGDGRAPITFYFSVFFFFILLFFMRLLWCVFENEGHARSAGGGASRVQFIY